MFIPFCVAGNEGRDHPNKPPAQEYNLKMTPDTTVSLASTLHGSPVLLNTAALLEGAAHLQSCHHPSVRSRHQLSLLFLELSSPLPIISCLYISISKGRNNPSRFTSEPGWVEHLPGSLSVFPHRLWF